MYIKARRGRIVDIKYQVQGCGAAIATYSALSAIAKGKTLQEAWRLTDQRHFCRAGRAAPGEIALLQPGCDRVASSHH
jgi:NifU-like protein involved in Fe-S cluster formation